MRRPLPYHHGVFRPLARLPRSVLLLGGAYLVLVTFVAAGLHHALDRAIAAPIWQDAPCWAQQASAWASVLFAAEVSLVYALALAALCLFTGRPLTGLWIVFVLVASVGVEVAFKVYFEQPAPSEFFATLSRPLCREPGPGYPLTIVPTPSSLPSGYSIRAAYYCLLVAALVGARWPQLRRPIWISLTLLAVVFGASRVVVSWHWPSDVVAGLLLGAMGALLVSAQANGFTWLAGQRPRSGRGVAASRPSLQPARRSPRRR
jgi:membrane-associated phospholipid phosphatase